MRPFVTLSGIAAPLPVDNVDTDALCPIAYLRRMDVDFARALLANWRFEGGDGDPKPDFVLNQPRFMRAEILVAGWNFGCGSSREHAVWALAGYGIRCVVAKSFGGIFFDNCLNNGVLAVELPEPEVDSLLHDLAGTNDPAVTIDLPMQTIVAPGGRSIGFEIDEERKRRLVNGLDDIGLTLQRLDAIDAFRQRHFDRNAWLGLPPAS